MCIRDSLIIICLSYNILLGQGGMLSFGHAVYTGLGSFIAIHAMNMTGHHIPLVLIPIVGGLAGMFFAILLGGVTTKKSGTTFAMITLGIGELVASMALMFPEFFGGEGGITTNRVYGSSLLGLTFGPQIEVYYLIAVYCFICTMAMFAFTGTPLGRIPVSYTHLDVYKRQELFPRPAGVQVCQGQSEVQTPGCADRW